MVRIEGHQMRATAASFTLLRHVDGSDSAGLMYEAGSGTKLGPVAASKSNYFTVTAWRTSLILRHKALN